MAALVEGTVVKTTNDKPLWNDEFDRREHQVTRQPVLMKLKMIEQALGVKFIRDQAARRLIAFGPEAQRELACELACTAAMVNHRTVDPRNAHHWQRLDLQEFQSTLRQYIRSRDATVAQSASAQLEKPLFRKVINVPSHVASSSREELERLQRAVGRDPKRPLRLSSLVPSAEDQEPLFFRKHVPKLSNYAKAFLDTRLNPRFIPSDKSRNPEEVSVEEQSSPPQPPASKEHTPNPEGLKKLDEMINAMRNPPTN
ncbi:hypothetical protein DL546_003516 [Coniochaeta pulveracea]|uniref:Uncharacterized protein n=1 Tax=Coniochaeta pulveracea TaxID=177199 RepID=A0A420YB51_9PEZI|nr:hypothetical protein DL546_003516 [Coniochaeta pulveracea]